MKLYRYMPLRELYEFCQGSTLKNTIDHSKLRGSASTVLKYQVRKRYKVRQDSRVRTKSKMTNQKQ